MKAHAFRLRRGDDLYESIAAYARLHHLPACALVCAVGCVSTARVRNAGGEKIIALDGPLEIVSLTGTVGAERVHLHISFSDARLQVFGGHLQPGCIVDTTAEIVLLPLSGYVFHKVYDEETGYNEIDIEYNGGGWRWTRKT